MSISARVRLADLGVGDTVETPSRKVALVIGFPGDGRAALEFLDGGGEVTLQPHLLKLVQKARPRALPAGFFGAKKVAE